MAYLPRFRFSLRACFLSAAAVLLSACGDGTSYHPVEPPIVDAVRPLTAAQLAQIDAYVSAQMERQHIPGMSVVVTRHGKPLLQKGYGKANLSTGAAMTEHSVFRIGSVTKQFTASAIMMLVQEGRITLDQPVSRIFPTAPAAWNGMTIRHLLTHTSGLQRDLPRELIDMVGPGPLPPIDQLISLAGNMPLEYAPGTQHAYSNVGYHLLGFVIEKVTGQHYADFLRQRVFKPLGMSSADVIVTTRPVQSMAAGYTWDGAALKPASTFTMTPGVVEAEGGLQMSAVDLAKWDASLASGRFLSTASLAAMWSPARLTDGTTVDYGFGWVLDSINRSQFVYHDGLVEGFTTQFAHHGNEGIAVIVLANTDSALTQRVMSRIRAIAEPRLDWIVATDPQPQTGALLRTLVEESARGVLQADQRFTPSFQAFLTPEVLASFTAYLQPWGPIEQFGYIDQVTIDGTPVARYLVRSKYDQAVLGIGLDAQGRVAFLNLLSE